MSITETTDSPQHKLHWLAEQALSWSGLPVVTVRPTVFLEGFFLLFAAASVRDADELALPLGWRCRWAPARPRPSHRSTSRAPSRRSSTTRRHTSVTSTI
ncbi:MAG TPA: hypothetical protein VHT21_18725, partial [Stellaceae bacterium]|nr:hypothetical protein [Stellaceae bacterium]